MAGLVARPMARLAVKTGTDPRTRQAAGHVTRYVTIKAALHVTRYTVTNNEYKLNTAEQLKI
jgi:hypothetical protein